MRAISASLLVLVLAIGCQSPPQNFSEFLGAGYLTVETAANTIRAECGNVSPGGPCMDGRLISTDEKNAAKRQLQDALRILNAARDAKATGDDEVALARIRQAQLILQTVEAMLTEKGLI